VGDQFALGAPPKREDAEEEATWGESKRTLRKERTAGGVRGLWRHSEVPSDSGDELLVAGVECLLRNLESLGGRPTGEVTRDVEGAQVNIDGPVAEVPVGATGSGADDAVMRIENVRDPGREGVNGSRFMSQAQDGDYAVVTDGKREVEFVDAGVALTRR